MSAESDKQSVRLFGPDLARAMAIVMVMLSHTLPGFSTYEFIRRCRGLLGTLGVELFFVLSGYLIGGILLKNVISGAFTSTGGLLEFWKRRWFRTLPNYYLFLLANLLLVWKTQQQLPPSCGLYFFFSQALVSSHPTFFTVAWSLAVEEWFYLLFALALFLMIRATRHSERSVVLCILLFLAGPMVFRGIIQATQWDDGIRKVTLARLDSLMYGVALAAIQQYKSRVWQILEKCWPIGLIGIITVSIYLTSGTGMNPQAQIDKVWVFTGLSCSLFILFPRLAKCSEMGSWVTPCVQRLSLWSYSMYLSHALIAEGLGHFWESMRIHSTGLVAVANSALIWVLTLIFSAALYRYFERPVLQLRERGAQAKIATN